MQYLKSKREFASALSIISCMEVINGQTHSLFQLDVGTTERICLTSRDDQSVLVVSYHDLKACLETAFNHLVPAGMRS